MIGYELKDGKYEINMFKLEFRKDKPKYSGEYAVVSFFKTEVKYLTKAYYNAKTGRWYYRLGDGTSALEDVDMWAELPIKEENRR